MSDMLLLSAILERRLNNKSPCLDYELHVRLNDLFEMDIMKLLEEWDFDILCDRRKLWDIPRILRLVYNSFYISSFRAYADSKNININTMHQRKTLNILDADIYYLKQLKGELKEYLDCANVLQMISSLERVYDLSFSKLNETKQNVI